MLNRMPCVSWLCGVVTVLMMTPLWLAYVLEYPQLLPGYGARNSNDISQFQVLKYGPTILRVTVLFILARICSYFEVLSRGKQFGVTVTREPHGTCSRMRRFPCIFFRPTLRTCNALMVVDSRKIPGDMVWRRRISRVMFTQKPSTHAKNIIVARLIPFSVLGFWV